MPARRNCQHGGIASTHARLLRGCVRSAHDEECTDPFASADSAPNSKAAYIPLSSSSDSSVLSASASSIRDKANPMWTKTQSPGCGELIPSPRSIAAETCFGCPRTSTTTVCRARSADSTTRPGSPIHMSCPSNIGRRHVCGANTRPAWPVAVLAQVPDRRRGLRGEPRRPGPGRGRFGVCGPTERSRSAPSNSVLKTWLARRPHQASART